jgi:glycosyltransferase involved in cell wall biosynthesis
LVDTLRVLYDGWSILYQPNGPASTHLLTILAQIPNQVKPILALPGPAPAWLPEVETRIIPTISTTSSRLIWEQRILPQLARDCGAELLHLMSPHPPLLAPLFCVVSPCGFKDNPTSAHGPERPAGVARRLRGALAQGGLSRVRAIFWPEDLPQFSLPQPVITLPPTVLPDFAYGAEKNGRSEPGEYLALDLPETYILYHGPSSSQDLGRLLAAWSWAADPIGDYYPLVILGLDDAGREDLSKLSRQFDLRETVRALPELSPRIIPLLYERCSGVFHPAPVSPWGGPLRQALASGKPVVASENQLAAGLVGPGAYLVPGDDSRALGAALITTIVEEGLAQSLSQAARQRADSWRLADFGRELWTAYRDLTA